MNLSSWFFNVTEGIGIAFDAIRQNRVRAALTILGVAVGVFVVVTLAAAVHGINESVARDLESAGPTSFYMYRRPVSLALCGGTINLPRFLGDMPLLDRFLEPAFGAAGVPHAALSAAREAGLAAVSEVVALLARETSRLLEDAVTSLPEDFRVVFMLREVEGLSTRETAESLSLNEDTVKTRLHRARRHMRRYLGSRMGSAAPEAFQFHAVRCDRVVASVMAALRGRAYDDSPLPIDAAQTTKLDALLANLHKQHDTMHASGDLHAQMASFVQGNAFDRAGAYPGMPGFAVTPTVPRFKRLVPRAIISCSSSWLLERASAVSSEICFWK